MTAAQRALSGPRETWEIQGWPSEAEYLKWGCPPDPDEEAAIAEKYGFNCPTCQKLYAIVESGSGGLKGLDLAAAELERHPNHRWTGEESR